MRKVVCKSVLECIGNTPLLEVEGIFVKAEYMNPSGSIKDRIAQYILDKAEEEGMLKKGDTIVEASTGNTGTALALQGAVRGYKVIVYIARGLSVERYKMMRALGAELRFVPKNDTRLAHKHALELGKKEGYYCPDQFSNKWNMEENEKVLGGEIVRDVKKVDAFVAGIGTGGTVVGVGKAVKKVNPKVKVFGVEPAECSLVYDVIHKHQRVCHPHVIEGIADGIVPDLMLDHLGVIDDVILVHGEAAVKEALRLARDHGLFVGYSSGANFLAAKKLKKEYNHVVTVFPDEGEKYLSEEWFRV